MHIVFESHNFLTKVTNINSILNLLKNYYSRLSVKDLKHVYF